MDAEQPLISDVIIPVYGERSESLAATLSACLRQTCPVSTIFVVDDGSPEPVTLPHWATSLPIRLLRLPSNQGIAAARNAAVARSTAPFLACINVEILPDPDWLGSLLHYLASRPSVGACYSRMVPVNPNGLLSRWRMRFHEARYGERAGPARFAPGHAVLFRKKAIECVGGYNIRFRRIMEDSDICERMQAAGWETHYVPTSQCISIQKDSLHELCRKQLVRSGWTSPRDYSLWNLFLGQCKWLFMRVGRNLAKGRLQFVPVDLAIWAGSLYIALPRYLSGHPKDHGAI
jgi:cellulose synthase/poly-beta-1,6-N-acetylglucosamine synthase-like glycosyltransferase